MLRGQRRVTLSNEERQEDMSEHPLRCGVVGVGRMGRHHARVYAQLPETDLVGVVDTNAEARSAIVE